MNAVTTSRITNTIDRMLYMVYTCAAQLSFFQPLQQWTLCESRVTQANARSQVIIHIHATVHADSSKSGPVVAYCTPSPSVPSHRTLWPQMLLKM